MHVISAAYLTLYSTSVSDHLTSNMTDYFAHTHPPKAVHEAASIVIHDCPHDNWDSNLAWLRIKIAKLDPVVTQIALEIITLDWNRMEYVKPDGKEHSIIIRFVMSEYTAKTAGHRILKSVMTALNDIRVEATWSGVDTLLCFLASPDDILGGSYASKTTLEKVAQLEAIFKVNHPRIELVGYTPFGENEILGGLLCPSPSVVCRVVLTQPNYRGPVNVTYNLYGPMDNVESCCTLIIDNQYWSSPVEFQKGVGILCSLIEDVYNESSV